MIVQKNITKRNGEFILLEIKLKLEIVSLPCNPVKKEVNRHLSNLSETDILPHNMNALLVHIHHAHHHKSPQDREIRVHVSGLGN